MADNAGAGVIALQMRIVAPHSLLLNYVSNAFRRHDSLAWGIAGR